MEDNKKVAKAENSIIKLAKMVTIIIVTYNNLKLTKRCINSIFKYSNYPDLELIIIDNNSHDGTKKYLNELGKKKENINVILNRKNKGYGAANNQGIKVAKGDYIIFLNNDTVVTANWINRLLKHLNKTRVGMVGPLSNSVGNEARLNIDFKNLDDMQRLANKISNLNEGRHFEIGMISLFCAITKADVITKAGPLDEKFELGFFEDDDFSKRIIRAGYRLICAEDVFIYHAGSASFNKMDVDLYLKIFNKNKKYFEKKWNVKWTPHLSTDKYLPLIIDDVNSTLSNYKKLESFQLRLKMRLKTLQDIEKFKDDEIKRMENILRNKNNQIKDIKNSTSWKITKPIRKAKAVIVKSK